MRRLEMAENDKQNYEYTRPNIRKEFVKPAVHLDTMAGKQVGLMVNRMKTMDVMGKDGKPKSFVIVDAVKRGDLDDQHNQYDGQHVVNRKLSNGSIVHGQAITNDSAKKIMEVNGYTDVGRKDYDKIASQQRLLFNTNVFRPDTNKKNDYKFNPNPDVINESNVPFDVEKHQHNRALYSTKPISKDLDAEL